MPVNFYPSNPIDALEDIIVKDDGTPLYGEISIYRLLSAELGKSALDWDIWHDLKLPDHSGSFNYYQKVSCQIDFLILCKHGLLILEVKGGAISTKENHFFYGKNFETKINQNPFRQAEGCKYTIKDNILNNVNGCFFCEAVAFPHVDYPFESKLFDQNLLWTEYLSRNYGRSIEAFILSVFHYSKAKHTRFDRSYAEVSPKERSLVRKTLSPTVSDRNSLNSISTTDWLGIQNIDILDGLNKNERIMIEGPPGSGKTTLAKAYIDKQFNKRGIYLCWNNLLMHYTKDVLSHRGCMSSIEVTTYFRYFQKLNPKLSYNLLASYNEDKFYNLVKDTISRFIDDASFLPYDFVVIDEAQDLFDRGLDLFLNKFCGSNGQGLKNGSSLLLYDIDQSYSYNGRNVHEIADLFSEYYCHYKINEVKRSTQSPDIRKLSLAVLNDPTTLLKGNIKGTYPSIDIVTHKSLSEAKSHLVKNVLASIRAPNSSLRGEDCTLLVESSLLRGLYKGEDLAELLIIKDIEEISEANIADRSNKLRYTTILKFKGLEKKNIFLIITEPTLINQYEIYIGLTRAILNVQINIIR
ncbi:NERD domain-containing protein [Dyadobacter sp. CY261]|uniref:nuclease-related domain-containing DEAD/DEAH box helicase n=1 Tax=Dyadobacter sp. CY261 TaxID=2907203 RepID=UPI001F2AFB87|nr:NERD domain-containing protein [Dyadobacter sp. CY261]MCF0075334.1 NERD domain-containing protein [Dyadobacter sp. CY261]